MHAANRSAAAARPEALLLGELADPQPAITTTPDTTATAIATHRRATQNRTDIAPRLYRPAGDSAVTTAPGRSAAGRRPPISARLCIMLGR
jgi:hypothetical protein